MYLDTKITLIQATSRSCNITVTTELMKVLTLEFCKYSVYNLLPNSNLFAIDVKATLLNLLEQHVISNCLVVSFKPKGSA